MNFQDKNIVSDDLLIKYVLAECNSEEQVLVESWLNADEQNKLHYEKVKNLWNLIGDKKNKKEFDSIAAWEKVRNKISENKKEGFQVKRFSNLQYWAVAASFIIGIVSFLWLYNDKNSPPEKEILVYKKSFSGVVTDTLPDKSIVCLNKESELAYSNNLGNGMRIVHLKGEAFFNVTHDATKPFIVKTEKADITVLGTSFNVNENVEGNMEVIVKSGIVSVKTRNDSVILYKNEKALIDKENNKIIKTSNDNSNYNYYQSKQLTFNNTELEKVVFDLNKVYNVSIIIDDKIKKCKLTASFKQNESLDSILNIIQETLGISITKNSTHVIMSGSGC
jgi:transmembrane sensor